MFQLDGNFTKLSLNRTNFDDVPTLVWSANNLADGDHQLQVAVTSAPLQRTWSVVVDYFEYVVPLLHFVMRIVFQQDLCFQA